MPWKMRIKRLRTFAACPERFANPTAIVHDRRGRGAATSGRSNLLGCRSLPANRTLWSFAEKSAREASSAATSLPGSREQITCLRTIGLVSARSLIGYDEHGNAPGPAARRPKLDPLSRRQTDQGCSEMGKN